MLSFITVSDTHSSHGKIPQEWLVPKDVIIHSGDISGRGYEHELKNFFEWYSKLSQYKYKIFIAGNHDWLFQNHPEQVQELLKEYPNIIYLQDSFVEIEGIKIYGSPWQPWFYNWAFNLQRGKELQEKWNLIPSDIDILITHGPVYGCGDLVDCPGSPNNGEHVGCKDLLEAVERIKPKFHIAGHIHDGHGTYSNGTTTFINAATLNEDYKVAYEPITFEI